MAPICCCSAICCIIICICTCEDLRHSFGNPHLEKALIHSLFSRASVKQLSNAAKGAR